MSATNFFIVSAMEECHAIARVQDLLPGFNSAEDATKSAFDSLCKFYEGFDSTESTDSWVDEFKNEGFQKSNTTQAYWCEDNIIFVSFYNCCKSRDCLCKNKLRVKRPAEVVCSWYYGTCGGLVTDFNFAVINNTN